jgi:hemin uptake protein HemP
MPDTLPPTPAPPPRPQRSATTTSDTQEVLLSSALLGPRQAIEIEHNGQRYRLQSTKSGKLILTK